MKRRTPWILCVFAGLTWFGCSGDLAGPSSETTVDPGNPFVADYSDGGKQDTGYINPDGIEVEVSIEADVRAPSYRIFDAPAELGQFAVTYLRTHREFYLESLAEDPSSDQRVEWLVEGTWISAAEARRQPVDALRHFRIQGINAVMLHGVADGAHDGQTFSATVPIDPYAAYADGGVACADPDDHLGMSASIYWYLWNPERTGCRLDTQSMRITVTRLLPARQTTYPEYDRLVADHQITAVVLFGQIGDELDDSDSGVRNLERMARSLTSGGYREVTPAPLGRRFEKTVAGVEFVIDLYSPYVFSGLSDMAHFDNFQRAIGEHEIVAYDGHSMLGASDFWSRPEYPDFYQIFLYGGCLGYEYYVRPIVEGKGGFANVDLVSSVVEVSADANYFFAPFMGKLTWALEHDNNASWSDYLKVIREYVGDSTFGVSGARDNCFTPAGSLCAGPTPSTSTRFEGTAPLDIPDDTPSGVRATLRVPTSITPVSVSLELSVSHTWVGDLEITLQHGSETTTVWDHAGGSDVDIHQTFALDAFRGQDAEGEWTLSVADTAAADTGRVDAWALVLATE